MSKVVLTSEKIKNEFINYFINEGYFSLNSKDLIPDSRDKTLLFTNSIMSRFKGEFSGKTQILYKNIVTNQRCLKIGGQPTLAKVRHSLESIGEGQSLSLLEQLGICCFDTKSKEEIITHIWDFFTIVLSLPISNFLITVDEKDIEVFNIWRKIGIRKKSIIKLNELQWRQFDDLRICGFCTHFIYDRGLNLKEECKNPKCNYNCDCGRFLDLGDIVFFDHICENNDFVKSNKINVDCGLGLERITMIIEDAKSIFDISIFKSLVPLLEKLSNYQYNTDVSKDIAFKAILDHTRTIIIAIGDNILPGKRKREHVIRKIIRHTIRSGWKLEIQEIFLHKLIDYMLTVLNGTDSFSYLKNTKHNISEIVESEEILFYSILKNGKKQFNKFVHNDTNILSGNELFILYDRYGLPIDYIELLSLKNKIKLDYEGFNSELQLHKEKSKNKSC